MSGKTAIITGGAGGLGVTIAKLFFAAGCGTALVDTNAAKLAEAVEVLGASARPYICDITSPDAVAVAAGEIRKDFRGVDILVNNAGIVTGRSFLSCPDELIEKTMAVNSNAHFWVCVCGNVRVGVCWCVKLCA